MKYKYEVKGTCAIEISFNLEDNIVSDISFNRGCSGNLKMISKILDGWDADKIIDMCEGNICGLRNTSCADQLAKSIRKALEEDSTIN